MRILRKIILSLVLASALSIPSYAATELKQGGIHQGYFNVLNCSTGMSCSNSGITATITSSGGSSPLTTKGDVYTYSSADARLAVGTNGQILSSDSTATTGLKWITAAGSGDMIAATYDPATISEQLVGLTATQTLTNKTLTSPKINENVALTTTATKLNYLTSATGTTGTASTNVVFSTSPTLTTPALGAATYTTLSGGAVTDSALTATRVTFAGTAGLLSDDADLTFATDTLTMTKGVAGTTFTVPNGTGPSVAAAGNIAVDTTDDQLIYYGGAKRVIPYEKTACIVLESLAATDDNYAFYMANDAITVTGVGCNCRGTCSTLATFTLEDRGGNAMTITGTNPTCATTGAATFAAVTASNGVTAGEMVAFDVTNTPTTGDTYALCIQITTDAQ